MTSRQPLNAAMEAHRLACSALPRKVGEVSISTFRLGWTTATRQALRASIWLPYGAAGGAIYTHPDEPAAFAVMEVVQGVERWTTFRAATIEAAWAKVLDHLGGLS